MASYFFGYGSPATIDAEPSLPTSTDADSSLSPQQALHHAAINTVISKLSKIQKEVRGRKYKDLQNSLNETVDSLKTFRDSGHSLDLKNLPSPPEWMNDNNDPSSENQQPNGVNDDDSIASFSSQNLSQGSPADPMNPAIIMALHTLVIVMTHPYKTPKLCEYALECVTLLISKSYISGRAGLRQQDTANSASGLPSTMMSDGSTRELQSSVRVNNNNVSTPVEAGPSILHQLIEGITKCSESPSEIVQTLMTKSLLALMTSPKCGVHEASMLTAVRATFHVYLVTKNPGAKQVSKETLIDMLKCVFNRMETMEAVNHANEKRERSASIDGGSYISLKDVGTADKTNSTEEPEKNAIVQSNNNNYNSHFASQYHTDGYLLFRALCKLSAKPLPGDEGAGAASSTKNLLGSFSSGVTVDPLALHSKILSLELILSVFEHCGEAFRTSDKFVYAVQNYLCVSLLKNCMSSHTEVAYLSLRIFLVLVYNFKSHLKSEIEVFLANIFLKVLESPNSPMEQKALVLEALRALCSDPTMLTQLFLNYDCDFDAPNLFRNIVHSLTRLSNKSPSSSTKKDNTEDIELSLVGLEVLVMILRAFLKALNLPGGDDDAILPSPTNNGRHRLQLDIGLAVRTEEHGTNATLTDDDTASSVLSDSSKKAAHNTNQIVEAFDRKRTVQQNFETGLIKFTLSGKQGLQFFIANEFVKQEAHSIALFFHKHCDQLDKTQIGEILGREPDASFDKHVTDAEMGGDGFYVRVLHHYVDVMDFTGLVFDDAIRSFLSGFRLPGEAQKIDRIMEKFAERFTRQNEDVFSSADTAFILGFSVIMLNTDLHNPNIKQEKKMTLESFIRNNRGISVDGGDLPVEMLEGIFNRILAKPFTLKEDDDARAAAAAESTELQSMFVFDAAPFLGGNAEDRRREKFRKEKEDMMNASEQLFKRRPKKASSASSKNVTGTDDIKPSEVIKPMFDVTWGPLIGTLSQVLEITEDHNSIALCLNGFVYAVRISSHSGMSLARDTFVNSLAKFTTLGSMKEMKYKNIESIRTLLSIAIIDGEFLAESWGPVLQCISQLALLQLSASGLARDDEFLTVDHPADNTPESGGFFRTPTAEELARETEESNGRAVLAAVNEILIDKVFSSSVKLSARGIVHFIEQLIAVSVTEITGDGKKSLVGIGSAAAVPGNEKQSSKRIARHSKSGDRPRIFSLQRLVEVADYNMEVRPRITWTQMWEMMSNHFATIGCHKNAQLSMFAIDSLRQLSFKFLEKPELSDFNFQRLFLRPFLLIMENPGSREDIRELVLRCVDNMIRLLSRNLRSGWKIFFSILALSARDPSEKISTLGLAILQRLLDEHLDQLCRLSDGADDVITTPENSNVNTDPAELSASERKRRNANAEDFVGLCRASLSFVQTEELAKPLPIGLSMRALCHTACYADLIAEQKVLPPVGHSQSIDPFSVGFTYPGLPEDQGEQMALWRPLFDGLAAGISSTARSNSGGVGCLVHRGSIMTTRAILLRHGKVFSPQQLRVLLQHVLLPAIQSAAEYDNFPVINIVSESPALSSLDFLAEALPLPPEPSDEGLAKFKEQSANMDNAPRRAMGPAELLVEASFADLRHGGDGNLSRAHGLKKGEPRKNFGEQPFPDSWIATTAPIAMGMLTDVLGELILHMGVEGRQELFPILLSIYRAWALGTPTSCFLSTAGGDEDDISVLDDLSANGSCWKPCEALVRIGCVEFSRTATVLASVAEKGELSKEEVLEWWKVISESLAETIRLNAGLEVDLHHELVESKLVALGIKHTKYGERIDGKVTEKIEEDEKENDNNFDEESKDQDNSTEDTKEEVKTPYGVGTVTDRRTDRYEDTSEEIHISEVELSWGATLYGCFPATVQEPIEPENDSQPDSSTISSHSPQPLANRPASSSIPRRPALEALSCENYLDRFVPALKTRCVAAHILNQYLPATITAMQSYINQEETQCFLSALDKSRTMALQANRDEDLVHAFKEAMRSEWDDGVEEVERALAAMGRSSSVRDLGGVSDGGGGEMFFLTQEAGANRAMIHLLMVLYTASSNPKVDDSNFVSRWEREAFAENKLMTQITRVLQKFLDSERTEGHLLDVNVWRSHAADGATKVPMVCTSFVGVVMSILNAFLIFSEDQFRKHLHVIYPVLCDLVQVQSEEVRQVVRSILIKQVGSLIGQY